MKRKTTSALILNLSYGAIEKLVFPGRVITAAKKGPFASKFERVMAHQGLHMAHLPAALSFLHKISASCHSVSLIKKSAVLKRFLGVTLAVNQIIAEPLASSLQPFSLLNNKWIIDFSILPGAPAPAPLAAPPSPLCQQPHLDAGLSIPHRNQDANCCLWTPQASPFQHLKCRDCGPSLFPLGSLFSIVPRL